MALKLITASTALAVTLAEAKAHLRVDSSDEDTLITAMITSATETAEQITGRAIMPQTWELTLDAFPDALELTRVPAVSVTSIKYFDVAGVQQTLASNAYALDAADDFGFAYIVPAYDTGWPVTRDQINAVAVQYVAGYANAAGVPAMPPYVEADEIQGAMLAEIDELRQKLAAVESQTAIPAQVQQYPACITMEAAYEMGSKGAKPTESERLLFESWMRGHCWAVIGKWDGRTYTETGSVYDGAVGYTRQLWAVWRDRAALCASPSNTQKT